MDPAVLTLPVASMPPTSQLLQDVNTYAWPEIRRICGWLGGVTLVTLVIKRLSAR